VLLRRKCLFMKALSSVLFPGSPGLLIWLSTICRNSRLAVTASSTQFRGMLATVRLSRKSTGKLCSSGAPPRVIGCQKRM